MSGAPSFAELFAAIHPGRSPFPWQVHLAEQVLETGWPELLDLPTGAGKTSALDVALYCLARRPDRMPRRTLLVVDRRIVVDQGADHARAVQKRLISATDGPARWIADALRGLWSAGSEEPPFAVAVMRGGMPRDNDWARRPDEPVVGVTTVDQVGSRLLFRGYGVAPRSASIHAGLLGNDTLILLDEVHLAVPFAQTLEAIRTRFRSAAKGLPARFHVVQMSATPGTAAMRAKRFGLSGADREHPILGTRLRASKRARLVPVKVTGSDEGKKRHAVAERAVAEAGALLRAGARVVGVVVNRVDTARLAYALLQRDDAKVDAILVTGRMRPIDRERLVNGALLPRAGTGRDRTADHSFVVVATQCIEAGADLDFDGMITECASLDALRQRFGRVDRGGALRNTMSVILARSDQIADGSDDPIYGGALAATWSWLEGIATDGIVDFGISAFDARVVADDVLAPHADAPVMLPAHVDAWSQTSPLPSVDPDIALWLHGPKKDTADVQIVWRVGAAPTESNRAGLVEELLACRPSTLEAISIPLNAARAWLNDQPSSAIADVMAGDEEGSEETRPRHREGQDTTVALCWKGEDSRLVTANELRPGDVLVVDATKGGLAAYSFDPDAKAPVTDLGDLAQLRGRGVAMLRLRPATLEAWALGDLASAMPLLDSDESLADLRQRVRDWLLTWPDAPPEGFVGAEVEWRAARRAWRSPKLSAQILDGEAVVHARVSRHDLQAEPEVAEALTEDDDSSFRQTEVTLSVHSTDVRDLAEKFARAVGFPDEIVEDLALAGWFHDVGKADSRFQRWMVGGSDVRAALLSEPLAKSALPAGSAKERWLARQRSGYPAGYRHELLSLAMVEAHADALARAHDPELVLHLVASHHGWCRPFAPALDHPDDSSVTLAHGGIELTATTRHGRSRLNSGVADRFWSLTGRYGWWGLAWLEAVLRLADHRASEMETEG